jgi:secreted trypsin-like serine protease
MKSSLKKFLSLSLIAGLLTHCGDAPTSEQNDPYISQRIINGNEIDPTAYPQIIKLNLTLSDGSAGICSGTVIGSNSVLTAGHCFPSGIRSASIEKSDGSSVAITKVYVHPGYTENLVVNAIFNDVAIAKTSTPIGLPALGIIASQTPTSDDLIGIYGYGYDEDRNLGTLRSGTMSIDLVTDNHIFATFDDLSDTCNGDSGGPATISLTDATGQITAVGIVGITSSGSKSDCSQGDLSLFTNVQTPGVLNFIKKYAPEVVIQ